MRLLALGLALTFGITSGSVGLAAASDTVFPDIHVEVPEKIKKTKKKKASKKSPVKTVSETVFKVSNARITLGAKPTLSVEIGSEPERHVPLEPQDLRSLSRQIEKLKKQKPQNQNQCHRNFVQLTFEDGKPRAFCLETRNTAGLAARTLVRRLDLALKVRSKPPTKSRASKPGKPVQTKK